MKLDDDDFALFGLPQQFAIDRAQLDDRWRALQAEVHPDRFAAQGAAAQRLSMQWAVRVNEAYRRLKDPLARGSYLTGLRGGVVDAERNTAMPADFLMQQMGWREALEDAQSVDAIEALDQTVAQNEKQRFADLEVTLDQKPDAEEAARQVRALMFVARFREDIQKRLEALDA